MSKPRRETCAYSCEWEGVMQCSVDISGIYCKKDGSIISPRLPRWFVDLMYKRYRGALDSHILLKDDCRDCEGYLDRRILDDSE